jgi:hypothetical protein
MLMRGRSFGYRLAMRGLVAGVCIGLAAIVVFWWPARQVERNRNEAPVTRQRIVRLDLPVTAEELATTFQGPIERTDGSEDWIVLSIRGVRGVSDPLTFSYVINSPDHEAHGDDGSLSLRLQQVRFAGFRGEIVRSAEGGVVLRSGPTHQLPRWSLEARELKRDEERSIR